VSNFGLLYDKLETRIRQDGHPTLELRPRLDAAYDAIISRPYDPDRIAAILEQLLEYLTSQEGRTHANCVAVDSFFLWTDEWEGEWEDEPSELADILSDMGGALHDTFGAPQMAENFDSTPEQLLERVRAFRASRRAA
jgi:hypothetical protein